MTKKIPLTRGKCALVDDCDFHWINQIKWQCDKYGYARGDMFGGRRSKGKVLMHRLILMAPDSFTVDHINHDTLDNRRENLRLASQSEQNQNRKITKGKSKYKGVYLRSDFLKWVAQIKKMGKQST